MVFVNKIKNETLREIVDWIFHICIAIIIALLITNFLFQRTIVNRTSMYPTLGDGDSLIIEKISLLFGDVKKGDIITLKSYNSNGDEGNILIKRVIAIEGDTVKIANGKVYVNGKAIKEDYIYDDYTENTGDYTDLKLKKGYIYVLGDNRKDNIIDSRTIGPINIDDITGKAVFRLYPFSKIRFF